MFEAEIKFVAGPDFAPKGHQLPDAAFRDVTYNPEVVRRSQNQAEFKKSL